MSEAKKGHLDSMEEGVSMEVQDLFTTNVEKMMIGIVRCEMDMEELDHNKGGRVIWKSWTTIKVM